MAINFVKMFDPEATQDTRADYKQKMALAQSLLAGDTGAVYSPAAGIAKVAEKAAGGWLARSIQDEENKAQDDAWNSVANSPLVKALIGGAGSGASPDVASTPATQPPAPNDGGSGYSTSAFGGDPYSGGGEDASLYRQAIKDIESSGGNYGIVGPTHPKYGRALGAYQVMEANLPQWSKEVVGREVSPDEFLKDPNLQDRIFDAKFAQSVQKYGTPEDAASVWFTGRPRGGAADTAKDSLGTSGSDYVGKFASNLSRYRNQTPMATDAGAQVASLNAPAIPQGGPTQVASLDPSVGVPGGSPAPVAASQTAQPAPVATTQPTGPAPVQVAQAGPQANPLATALQPQIPTSIPPQLQETARQLMELGKNPRNRPFVMQQLGVLQQQVVEAQKTQQQRAWELQAEARKRGYQVEDRDLQWKREQPYKDSASSVAQGNLDVSRERLQHEKEKPMTLAPGTTVYDPAKNAGVFTAPNKNQTDQQTAELRKEILGLPSYKAIAGANPAFKSMVDAAKRDDKAADLNMVYALAKILDPTSVVREGEVQMANDTQGLADKLNGFIKSIQGEGRLAPEARLGLLQEARSRMEAFKGAYDTDRQFYRGIVTRRGYNEQDVIPDFGDLPTFDPAEINSVRRDGTSSASGNKNLKPLTPQVKSDFDAAVAAKKPRQWLLQRLIDQGYDTSGL